MGNNCRCLRKEPQEEIVSEKAEKELINRNFYEKKLENGLKELTNYDDNFNRATTGNAITANGHKALINNDKNSEYNSYTADKNTCNNYNMNSPQNNYDSNVNNKINNNDFIHKKNKSNEKCEETPKYPPSTQVANDSAQMKENFLDYAMDLFDQINKYRINPNLFNTLSKKYSSKKIIKLLYSPTNKSLLL